MKKIQFSLLASLALLGWLVLTADFAGAAKEKTDKERIVLLEQKVLAVEMELAEAREWAGNANNSLDELDARTQELNQRLRRVENNGPVAKVQR